MRGLWLASCGIVHHRRVDGTDMTVMPCLCSSAAIPVGQQGDRAVDDQLIQLCAMAAHATRQRMAPGNLKALRDSVGQPSYWPAKFGWDHKATAHGEMVNLLADAAGDPVPAVLFRDVPARLHDLMVAFSPAADDIIVGWRRRQLTLMRAREADGAAREMEQQLGGLLWMSSRVTERGTRRHRRVTGWAPHDLVAAGGPAAEIRTYWRTEVWS